jgi:hypothetical protein
MDVATAILAAAVVLVVGPIVLYTVVLTLAGLGLLPLYVYHRVRGAL